MPNRPAVHVRRFAYYEEFVIPGDGYHPQPESPPAIPGSSRDGLLPLVGRAAVAVGVTLLPLLAARLARAASRRAIGPIERPALAPIRFR